MDKTISKLKDILTGGSKEESAENEHSVKLNRWYEQSESARKEIDWKWFNYDLWVSGHHYAKWDKNTQQITSNPKTDGRPKVAINKIYTTLRGVRSYVLQNRPKADVVPYNLTQDNLQKTAKLNEYLNFLHDRLHLRLKLRATMWHALKYSVGFWQVLFDDEEGDGTGEIVVNVIDPYDLYWDPVARYPSEARYVILAVRRNLEDLKNDPKYKDADWEGVTSDSLIASSSLKSRMITYERGGQNYGLGAKKDQGTVIVKEYWYKERYDEEVEAEEDDNLDDSTEGETKPAQKQMQSKTRIMLCTKIGDKIIRGPIDTGLKKFPFFRLPSDIEPLSMYGTGWVKNLISANRELNRTESSVAEYNNIANKAHLVIDKGAGVRTITNQHGTFVERRRGANIEPLPVPQLSAEAQNAIVRYNRYIEDLGALHEASLGRIPTGANSGVAIEALQQGDSNNLSELVENTEEFLEDVYEYILYLASQKYQFARNIITTTTAGQKEFLKIIGEGAADTMKQDPGLTVIPENNIVDVKIGSWLANTPDGRRQAVEKLSAIMGQNGYQLPADFILEAFETGSIADVVLKMQQQQQKKQQQEQQAQAEQAQQQQATQTQGALRQAAIQSAVEQSKLPKAAGDVEARALIRMILNGQRPEIPKNVSPEFINYLDHFAQSKEGQSLGGEFLSVIQTIRDQAVLEMRGDMSRVNQAN